MDIPLTLLKIENELKQSGYSARLFMAGGCVRDILLGYEPKDWDVEVYDVHSADLVETLSKYGKVSSHGESFFVHKLTNDDGEFDFSLPRREKSTGPSHKDFKIIADKDTSTKEACLRRDFTINSMLMSFDGTIIDHYGGQKNLKDGILHPTSAKFCEDPLRVLRAAQFLARFQFEPSADLITYSKILHRDYYTISKERIWGEWKKIATSIQPSRALQFLNNTGWLSYTPALQQMIFTPQDSEYHPEGDVFTHTCHVVDMMYAILAQRNIFNTDYSIQMFFAALCHDIGKYKTTKLHKGHIASHNHERIADDIIDDFFEQIGVPNMYVRPVKGLTKYHMLDSNMKLSSKNIKKLAFKLSEFGTNISELLMLVRSDMFGRGDKLPDDQHVAFIHNLEETASKFNVLFDKEPRKVSGYDLIKAGAKPGPEMGKALDHVYRVQLSKYDINKDILIKDGMGLYKSLTMTPEEKILKVEIGNIRDKYNKNNTFKKTEKRMKSALRNGKKFITFFRVNEEYGFLSQWFRCNFKMMLGGEECKFTSAEQAMMFMKANLFDDHQIKERILKTHDPNEVKKLGRQVKNFNEYMWSVSNKKIVNSINMLKFNQNEDLKERLLATNDTVLIEASPYDKIWGVGLSADDPRIGDPDKWLGKNLLGLCLMKVRDRILFEKEIQEIS